jgi:integrase
VTARIKVHVVYYADCKNLVLRYRDPLTGKYVRSTTYTDPQTGVETETGSNRKEARKLANLWEADLNAGRDRGRFTTTWEQFTERYEQEVLPSLAPMTAKKARGVFSVLESILPKVKGGLLRELTAERLSVWQAELRKQGRTEATISGHQAHLRAALAWAVDQGLLAELPKMKRPKRAKRSGGADPMKGRPISGEEFDRLLDKAAEALAPEPMKPKPEGQRKRKPYNLKPRPAIPGDVVESWRHLLRGLWWSGLRLGEALNLYWDRPDKLCVDLTGKRPMLRILAELEKGGRDRLLPIAPEFARFLLQTPEAERHGRVFKPLGTEGNIVEFSRVCRGIGLIGKAAGVKVATDPRTGKVKYASAHDLRRSFGERWASRVMPQVLMALMRHESIDTTMRYYVGRNANTTADAVWEAFERGQKGTVSGTVGQNGAAEEDAKKCKTPACSRS